MLKDYALEDHSFIDFSLLSSIVIHFGHIFDLLAKAVTSPYNQ